MKVTFKLYVTITIIIYLIVYSVLFRSQLTEYLDRNWRNVRCYPQIIPISGLSKSAPGNGFLNKTYQNFNHCTSGLLHTILQLFMKPLYQVLHGIKNGMMHIADSLNIFRKTAIVLREMFAALVENTANRMSNSYAAVLYFQEKIKILIKKQSAIFEVLNQFSSTLPFLLYSFTRGPIPRFAYWLSSYVKVLISIILVCLLCLFGGPFTKLVACPICAVCFPGSTLINLENNNTKPIRDIRIGEKIQNNVVTGKLYIKPQLSDIYNYNGVLVSGSHLIFEEDEWIRIQDSKKAHLNIINTELYCLITSNNTIHINNDIFRDYQETKDKIINSNISQYIANHLNGSCSKHSGDINHSYYWGFTKDTIIYIDDVYVRIEDLINKPSCYSIRGVAVLEDADHVIYNYNNVYVSGNTLVYENDEWIRVYQSKHSSKEDVKNNLLYNIITEDNIVIVKSGDDTHIKFRDFLECNDEDVNDTIDNMVTANLNL